MFHQILLVKPQIATWASAWRCAVPVPFQTITRISEQKAKVKEERKEAYLAKALAAFLAWTSLLMRMVSRLTGLGTKPTTPSSFTGRPIHHSLLNFCSGGRESGVNKTEERVFVRAHGDLCPRRSAVRGAVASVGFTPLWRGGSPWPRRWPPGPALERCRRPPGCTRSCNALQTPRACTEETRSQNKGLNVRGLRQSRNSCQVVFIHCSKVNLSSTCRKLFEWSCLCTSAQHFMCFFCEWYYRLVALVMFYFIILLKKTSIDPMMAEFA